MDVARRVADLMGGKVMLAVDPREQSNCVLAEVPLRMVCKLPPAGPKSAADLASREVVALVRDEAMRSRLASRLTASGIKVTWADNPEKAIAAVEEQNCAFVFLQYELDGSWLPVASRIRGLRANLPIVTVSAAGEKGQAEEAYRAGCWAYLTLPLKQRDLEDCLVLLERRVKTGGMAGRHIVTRFSLEEELRDSRTSG
jgi:DNA-binding response OmpR family regulator